MTKYDKRTTLICFLLFFISFIYFFINYKYYPGLRLSLNGYTEKDVTGYLYWDYGYGFNDLDKREIRLTAGPRDEKETLGKIFIEPIDMKDRASTGYMVWVVVDRKQEGKSFSVTGRHRWGGGIGKKNNERLLGLNLGSKLIIHAKHEKQNIKLFKSANSGFAKISAKNGPTHFINMFSSTNVHGYISNFLYRFEKKGYFNKIINDPYHSKAHHKMYRRITLPRHRIKGIKFVPHPEQLYKLQNRIENLEIKYKKERENSSKPEIVWVKDLKINGIRIGQNRFKSKFVGYRRKGEYGFEKNNHFLKFFDNIGSYEFSLRSRTGLGKIEIYEDDKIVKTLDLSSLRQKKYRYKRSPEFDLIDFRIVEASIENLSKDNRIIDNQSSDDKNFLNSRLRIRQSKLNLLLLIIQLITSFFISLLAYCFFNLKIVRDSKSFKEFCLEIFFRQKRFVFWIFFSGSVCINIIWWLMEWPGSMTPDSVQVWQNLKRLSFDNAHPYIYAFYILSLLNLFDSPVIVVLVQIISFSLLSAVFFFVVYRKGLNLYLILPFYFLLILSIPVNLFNITLWKDIPFNTFVIFWALYLTYAFYQKKYEGRLVQNTNRGLIILTFMYLGVSTFRHNGLIFIPLIPLMMFLSGGFKRSFIIRFCIFGFIIFLFYFLFIPNLVLRKDVERNSYAKRQFIKKIKQASFNKNYYLEDYIAHRTKIFIATLGTSPRASAWANDLHFPPQRWFSFGELRGEFKASPKIIFLNKVKKKVLSTTIYDGFNKGRFIHWNGLFAFIALIFAFLLYKWLPASAFFSFIFLFPAFIMFFFVWERWRYLYFIYLSGFYLCPICFLEIKNKLQIIDYQN